MTCNTFKIICFVHLYIIYNNNNLQLCFCKFVTKESEEEHNTTQSAQHCSLTEKRMLQQVAVIWLICYTRGICVSKSYNNVDFFFFCVCVYGIWSAGLFCYLFTALCGFNQRNSTRSKQMLCKLYWHCEYKACIKGRSQWVNLFCVILNKK